MNEKKCSFVVVSALTKKLNFALVRTSYFINFYSCRLIAPAFRPLLSAMLLLGTSLSLLHAQIPIGTWREHLPYYSAVKLVAGNNKVVCATPYSLFTVNLHDNTIERLSKINGLHETGIAAITLDETGTKLIVAYTNANLDIISPTGITNIDAVKRKVIPADKTVYSMLSYQGRTFLCTGFGIVVLDETKAEIQDTYIIGDGGNFSKVHAVTTDGIYFYAATDDGLKRAAILNNNLADYRNWQLISGQGALPAGAYQQAIVIRQQVIVQRQDTLFQLKDNKWAIFYGSDWIITAATISTGRVFLSQRRNNEARVLVLNEDGSTNKIIASPSITEPQDAISINDEAWIADRVHGLIRAGTGGTTSYQPSSPSSITTGQMFESNGSLWVTSGAVTGDWQNTFTRQGIYRFTANEWSNFLPGNTPLLNETYDLVSVVTDPVEQTLWAGSFGGGLLQLTPPRSFKLIKGNGTVEPSVNYPERYNVAGLAIDGSRNLWISNYGAASNLAVRKPDGSWQKFSIPFPLPDNAVSQIIIDDNNQKWILAPNGGGLVCFNHGALIENKGDDRWKLLGSGTGNGNLPDNNVLSLAKDKNGFIWIGTAKGIGIMQCPKDVFNATGCEVVLPIVQQDNFAGYLFKTEAVQAIKVDGADRKWIGTKNGVWLITADGEKTIHHFTAANSDLLDNDIRQIEIDPASGEVFFATALGICSYRGTATDGNTERSETLVFPNPVPPGYNGTIAIRGLVNNAIVKITELDGRLVYQTRANGGQATWNGKNYRGNTVASGVYLVLVSNDAGKEQIATKIVFIK